MATTARNPANPTGQQEPAPPANPLANVRDRLFHALFVRIALTYSRVLPGSIRRLLEFCLLIKAIACFFILIYVHVVFSHSPVTCLNQLKGELSMKNSILRVEVVRPEWLQDGQESTYYEQLTPSQTIKSKKASLASSRANASISVRDRLGNPTCLSPWTQAFTETPDWLTCLPEDVQDSAFYSDSTIPAVDVTQPEIKSKVPVRHDLPEMEMTWTEIFLEALFPRESLGWPEDYSIIEYSAELGFLRLSAPTRHRLGIPVLVVQLDAIHNECFGGNFSRTLLDALLGYDDVIMSSVKAFAESESESMTHLGYVRNVMTGEHYKFVTMNSTRWHYVAAFFIMFAFTFVISMLLRYSHHQIFTFIIDLLQMLEMNTPLVFPVAPLLIVILALVGMEAIMSEFFNDNSTAFYIILLVWCADQYDCICCHSNISKRYWLRFFYLYHFVFYAYHYRFNGQYSGLALLTSWLFIQHSMVFFFHHFELPLILQEQQVQSLITNMTVRHGGGRQGGIHDVLSPGGALGETTGRPSRNYPLRRHLDHPFIHTLRFGQREATTAATVQQAQPPQQPQNTPVDATEVRLRQEAIRRTSEQVAGNLVQSLMGEAIADARSSPAVSTSEPTLIEEVGSEPISGDNSSDTSANVQQ